MLNEMMTLVKKVLKSLITEIRFVISYQFLCAHHECDNQNEKLALVFVICSTYCEHHEMHANSNWLTPVKNQVRDVVLYFFACLLYSCLGASLRSVHQ